MDNRYLLIVFILIFCGITLFFIEESSDVIGSASVNFEDYTFSLPQDYEVSNTYESYIQIHNDKLGFLTVEHKSDKFKYNFSEIMDNLRSTPNTTILSTGIIQIGNISVDSIYFRTVDENGFVNNRSVFYLSKFDTMFQVGMSGFNYDNDRNQTINSLKLIVESLKPNYKK